MFNPNLVEYDATDCDGWDDRGHFTRTVSWFPIFGHLHETLIDAAHDCLTYAAHESEDIWWGIYTTHIISCEEAMDCRWHEAPDENDLERFVETVKLVDPIEIRSEFTGWLEEEFPEREEDDDDCGE